MGKTIIISNRLPVKISKTENEITSTPSAGGLATGLGSVYKKDGGLWIGWPGTTIEEEDQQKVIELLEQESMKPVFLTDGEVENYYEGFSNKIIWPIFHYFPNYSNNLEEYWECYKKVNQKFCDIVLQFASPGDTIWIHDYQLLLLPELLRSSLKDATIGFFQHIPFPSYEIFRLLPWRSEILKGMVGADLIGFHTYDDVRHFLSSVSRILGKDNRMGEFRISDRICYADSFPMGIDYQKFENAAKSPETIEEAKVYKESLVDRRLILSVDRLDYSKGIPERLKAYDLFLEKFPEFHNKVTLILVVVPSRDQVELYQKLKIEIDETVGRINGKYGNINWTPVRYFYRSVPFQTLSAFYNISDVALVTPLRDGMNLVCKEFIASKPDKTGVLILSEMAGAAKELSDAIIINPNDIPSMAEAINIALTMPVEEQVKRNEELQNILKQYDIHHWVDIFINRLQYVKEKQKEFAVRILNDSLRKRLLTNYAKAKERLIFLDYDGTLMPFNKDPKKVKPDEELLQLLDALTQQPNNKVIVISGRDKDTLELWLGHLKIDIIAEHGVWLKSYGQSWETLDYLTNEWKKDILPILQLFVDRTPGASIETKNYSLVFHYRKSDAELGELRSRELIETLQYLTTNMHLSVLEGNKVVEVRNADVNKGKAAQRWITKDSDFIMAAGDDWTDEEMFAAMPDHAFTIKIGYSSSLAKYNVQSCNNNNCSEIRQLLKAMAETIYQESPKGQQAPISSN